MRLDEVTYRVVAANRRLPRTELWKTSTCRNWRDEVQTAKEMKNYGTYLQYQGLGRNQ